MESNIPEYENLKQETKKIYSRIGTISCPILNDETVTCASEGFRHLLRKGRVPRSRSDQVRRLFLVKHIKDILQNPYVSVKHERSEARTVVNQHGDKQSVYSVADFWTLSMNIDGNSIKLVVRQFPPNGKKHFLSIMDSDNKKSRKKRDVL